jgi:hypothetical protein
MSKFVISVLVLVAGCAGSKAAEEPTAKSGNHCKAIAVHATDLVMEEPLKQVDDPNNPDAIAAKTDLRNLIQGKCEEAPWPPEVEACLLGAKSVETLAACKDAQGRPALGIQVDTAFVRDRIPECDAYIDAIKHFATCEKVDAAHREEFLDVARQLDESMEAARGDSKVSNERWVELAEECQARREKTVEGMASVGCAP